MTRCWTTSSSLTLLPGLVAWLVLTCGPPALAAGAPETSAGPAVERLIEDLGSNDFKVREEALRTLLERDEVSPALRRALQSRGLEVRRRVAEVVDKIEQKHAPRILAKAQALAKEGRIMEAVERIVAFASRDSQGVGGQALTQFAAKLLEQNEVDPIRQDFECRVRGKPQYTFPAGDFRAYADFRRPKEIFGGKVSYGLDDFQRFGGILFVRGEEFALTGGGFGSSLLAVSGDVSTPKRGGPSWSLIIAGGNVTLGGTGSSIIVCDGDVKLSGAGRCLIIAGGRVTGRCMQCAVRAEDYFQDTTGKKVFIQPGTPGPFGFVKFFEPADVGLKVRDRDGKGEEVEGGVFLGYVLRGSPFAPGLKAGDIVTAIDGSKTPSPEIFRKVLRKQLARGGTLTFSVLRSGQSVTVPIPYKD